LLICLFLAGCNTESEPVNVDFAVTPIPNPAPWWIERHGACVELANQGNLDIAFFGDSITYYWDTDSSVIDEKAAGIDTWNKISRRYRAGNFGFERDTTAQVIWRVTQGEFPPALKPRFVVLLIGTNNTAIIGNAPMSTAAGIQKIIDILHAASPDTAIILLPILPRGDNDYFVQVNNRVNEIIKTYHGRRGVLFYDIYHCFIDSAGQINKDLFRPDYVHLSARGYEVLGDKLLEYLQTL
jgi:lysophospholipase L1-like esterase